MIPDGQDRQVESHNLTNMVIRFHPVLWEDHYVSKTQMDL